MDFGSLMSRAWQITWKHKILWLFGILAGIGGGNTFNYNFGGGNRQGGQPGVTPGGQPQLPPQFGAQPLQWEILLIVGGVCLVVLVVVLVVLSIIGRGGLIGGLQLADERGQVTFREAWSAGTHYFWRLFGIDLLLLLPGLLLAVLAVFFVVLTAGLGVFCLLPLVCLLIPFFIVVSIIAHFAQFAVVLEDYRVVDAFRRGWDILASNLANIVVLGILLIVIQFIAGLILVAPFLAIIIPTVFFGFLTGTGQPNWSALAVGGIAFLCFLPIAIVLGGILNTWATGVWTLAYKQFMSRTPALSSVPPSAPPPVPA